MISKHDMEALRAYVEAETMRRELIDQSDPLHGGDVKVQRFLHRIEVVESLCRDRHVAAFYTLKSLLEDIGDQLETVEHWTLVPREVS